MIKNEQSLRFKALECRLRMEDIAFRWILVAAPYLNPEDKSGWKASDAIKFLRSELDPDFLTGRQISISPETPDTENPPDEDYEALEFHHLLTEQDVKLSRFNKFWNSMGQLLHYSPSPEFDAEKAAQQIRTAANFCDTLTEEAFISNESIQVVEMNCSHGNITKRNVARLKPRQIIPCISSTCGSAFLVSDTSPLSWQEVSLLLRCEVCGEQSQYHQSLFTSLSYWEIGTARCLNESCGHNMKVRWTLSMVLAEPR